MAEKLVVAEPLHDYVLVDRQKPQTETDGGILIPESAQEKPILATVRAVGPGRFDNKGDLIPMSVVPGDQVVLRKFGGAEIEVNGIGFFIVAENEILSKVKMVDPEDLNGPDKG